MTPLQKQWAAEEPSCALAILAPPSCHKASVLRVPQVLGLLKILSCILTNVSKCIICVLIQVFLPAKVFFKGIYNLAFEIIWLKINFQFTNGNDFPASLASAWEGESLTYYLYNIWKHVNTNSVSNEVTRVTLCRLLIKHY